MNLKFLTFLFLLISGVSIMVNAQELEREGISNLISSELMSTSGVLSGNEAFIKQIGDQNRSRSVQVGQSMLSLRQTGDNNYGYFEQIGSQNLINMVQSGFGNESSLWSIGQNITINSSQEGTRNVINAYLENEGIVSRTADLIQVGNGNRIEIALLGNGFVSSGVQSAEVRQTGNQNTLEAIFDPFMAPISVTQNPGVNGEGMRLNISTSSFNFPLRK